MFNPITAPPMPAANVATRDAAEPVPADAASNETDDIDWQCVANTANANGFVGAAVGGAAAVGAGAPLLPKSWLTWTRFEGRVGVAGGGRSGPRTSVISAVSRSFITGSAGRSIAGTANLGGIVGRVGSRISVVVGVGLEAYAAVQVLDAIEQCSQGGEP